MLYKYKILNDSNNNNNNFGIWVLCWDVWGLGPIPNPQSPIPNPLIPNIK